MSRMGMAFSAALIVAGSIAGLIHGIRAAVSYETYYDIKYRQNPAGSLAKLEEAEKSHDLYPWNYNLCIWASEHAYHNRFQDGEETEQMVSLAEKWCDRGLDLNPYKSQLTLLKARLMAKESPRAAAEFWEEYVDWNFWDPYHHAMLAKFYARAGRFWEASEELKWVKGSKHYEEAARSLKEAWKEHITDNMPPAEFQPREEQAEPVP